MSKDSSAPALSVYSEIMSEDSQGSSPCWKYLDSMILRSNCEIKRERKFLNEVCYPAGNLKVIVGLSVARGMLPSVRLINTILNLPEDQVSISFADFDWYEFLDMVAKLIVNDDDDGSVKTLTSENFSISTVDLLEEKIMRVKCNGITLCLCSNDIHVLLCIKHLINSRLELVKSLDFRTYYNDILTYVYNCCGTQEHFFDIVKNVCNLNMSERNYYMLELLHYNPQKMLDDFDKIYMCTDDSINV